MEKKFKVNQFHDGRLVADGFGFVGFRVNVKGVYGGYSMGLNFGCCDYAERQRELVNLMKFCKGAMSEPVGLVVYDGVSMANIDESTMMPTKEYLDCVSISCACIDNSNVDRFFNKVYASLPCRLESYRHFVDGADLCYGNYDIDEFIERDCPVIVTEEDSDAFQWYRAYKNNHPEAKIVRIDFKQGYNDSFFLDRSLLTEEEYAVAAREFTVTEID